MVIFPAITAALALVCSAMIFRDYISRPKPDMIVWTIAFAMFGIAALIEVIGTFGDWTPFMARLYYVCGATLVVGYLALGELYLLIPRKRADIGAGLLVILSALAVALVWRAPVATDVASAGWEALERGPGLTLLTISINTFGTVILVGGCVYSAVKFKRLGIFRNRTIGVILIAAGTLAVASGGTLARFGNQQLLYIAMAVGIGLIFAGYLIARQPDIVAPLSLVRPRRAVPAPWMGNGYGATRWCQGRPQSQQLRRIRRPVSAVESRARTRDAG